jgi:tripartite ATP-independent transporter DctM subunit
MIAVSTQPAAAPAAGLSAIGQALDRLLEGICIALLATSSAVAVLQVFCRYILNASLPWPEEVALWSFIWTVFLGMAVAVGRDTHIAIDLAARLIPPAYRAPHLFFIRMMIAATSVMLLVHGIDIASRASYASPAMQWSYTYLYMAVPTGAFLNLLYVARPRAGQAWNGIAAVAAGAALYVAMRYGAGTLYGGGGSVAVVLMAVGFGLILLQVPVAFALAFGAFAAFAPQGELMLITVPQNMTTSLNSFTLLAIPFFILAAAVMNVAGITGRLVDFATSLVGHLRGGLGQVNVLTNTLMAGVSGSSSADAAAIAKALVPEMERRGYSRPFSCALTSASSVLANFIPPSLGLIIYGALAQASVGALFVGTLVPGLLAAASLSGLVYITAARRGYGKDIPKATPGERLSALWQAGPALVLPLFIVGGIRLGVFTATEAGAVAVVYALFCGLVIYRRITGANLWAAARESLFDAVAVVVIIAAAAPFAWVLTVEQVPQTIAAGLSTLIATPAALLFVINLFLLVVGLFIEMTAAMVILVPILVPIVKSAGIDVVHFGIVLVMNLVIGALTPPMGMLVFTTARVGQANVGDVFRAVMPFVTGLIAVLALVTYLPALVQIPVRYLGP